jgi:chemotaxis family two-component system sensor kinase Cph1
VITAADRSREIEKLDKDLTRINRELEEFAYTATHDLKSPLRGISSYAQLILRGSGNRLEEVDKERVETIIRLALKMDSIIDGLLGYSELGHAKIRRSEVDLNEVYAQSADLLRLEIETKQAEIHIPRSLPILNCDQGWMGKIFYNLISNAIKYNESARPIVEIGFQQPAHTPVVLYFTDNGIGIAKEKETEIFRLFHRLHTESQYGGGTGLGLAIVAKAVERHNGRIWMESTMGSGTTFYLTLNEDAE